MNFSFNSYNKVNVPNVFLSYPNRKLICQLNVKKLSTPLKISGFSSVTFKIYQYANGVQNRGYDDITIGKYIFVDNIGWFRIDTIKKNIDSTSPGLDVTCYDLSKELTQTYLTSFGSMGTETDAQGGLDRYALYDANDQTHSIAHIFMAKNPGWTFKYIDDAISKNHRSFNNDSISSYEFLTGDVSDAFDCAFMFDGNARTVSAYKPENLGKEVPFIMSFQNLLKEIDIQWKEDDIKTVFHVCGGTDATGTALSIAGVNPDANDTISNFSYFYKDMSAELVDKLEEYSALRETNQGLITTALSQLKILQDDLLNLNNKMPSVESSTDWTQYGLVGLKAKSAEYKEKFSAISDIIGTDTVAKQQYDSYNTTWNAINAEVVVRQGQITAKEAEITAKKTLISSYVVNMYDILGDTLYKELQLFVREQTLTATSYVATESMTESQILQMKQDLYNYAVDELNRVCYPQFDMTINAVNFPVLKKYEKWTKQLELGDIILIQYSDKDFIKARILSMDLDWEDFTKFSLTISSKTSLTDGYFFLKELKNMVDKTSTTVDIRGTGYGGITKQANEAYFATQKEFLDLSLQQIKTNAVDQVVTIDNTGALFTKTGAPEKLWITNRQILLFEEPEGTNLKTPKLAIGKVYVTKNGVTTSYYGISADVCYGKMFFGQSLTIQNTNNTLTMDENGFKALATNGFSVQINPDTPDNIFTISENATKLMYIDAVNRKLVFQGRIEAIDGHIGGWTIGASTLTSGGVGMSSTTATNGVSFWAGNATPTSAPFRVLNNGYLYAANAYIAGTIAATAGTIGGWSIGEQGLTGNATTYIMGGRLNIGNGLLVANYNEVYIGDFVTTYTNRALFMSTDQYSGMSASTAADRFALWGGYLGGSYTEISNYVFAVSGTIVYAKDIRITGDPFWGGSQWTLTTTMEDVYERLDDLAGRISSLGG
jgi:hypothetical protein